MDPELALHSSDDEETLAMKENLLKIRLRKKQLAKAAAIGSPQKTAVPVRPVTPPPKPLATLQNPFASPKSAKSASGSHIQVPGSPSPQKRRAPISPARITLGIDKGRTGRDVSLRRTPEKPSRTFNQRLAQSKSQQHQEEDRSSRAANARTKSFNPVPAFSSSSTEAGEDSTSKLMVDRRKIATEDCIKAAKSVSKIFSILQFYAEVSPPEYELPENVQDFILFGIVASKSTAKTTSNGSKYCVLQLTDLKTDITMFLYDTAFEKYWTLPLGSLCYFLNPQHQRPRGPNTKLSVKMTDETGILEIGKSADFGVCRSMRKDGTQCTTWINAKKQEVCDYHIDLALAKSTNKRIEFASGTRLFDPRQPSKKKVKEAEEYAQHAVFFGDHITTMKGSSGDPSSANGGGNGDYDAPVKDSGRLQREAEARQREREVLARLMKNSAVSAGHEYFETTDPNVVEGEEPDEGPERDRVFSATMLRKLGFDPTKRPNHSVQAHGGNAFPGQGGGGGESNTEQGDTTLRDIGLQKNLDSVNLTVELGKGSALFTKEGIEAAQKAAMVLERGKLATAAEHDESDSDLEIVH